MRHPHTVAQLYGLPHGILHVFNTILYENEFQNPQIFQQTISLFPEQSTFVYKNREWPSGKGFWLLQVHIYICPAS
jgi:hypothetical protein